MWPAPIAGLARAGVASAACSGVGAGRRWRLDALAQHLDQRIGHLLEQGRATVDPAKRSAVYSELAQVLIKEVMPYAYLNTVTDTIVVKPHVKDLTVVPDGLVRFAGMWRQ